MRLNSMLRFDRRAAVHTARPIIALSLLCGCLCGCNTPPRNEGWSGNRVDPSADGVAEVGSTNLRSQDLVTATDKMAMDIATRLDIVKSSNRPRIVVGAIENRTSAPEQNYQIFLARLRAQLNSSGARKGIEFVRERSFVEDQRDREFGGKDATRTSTAYQSRADFMLVGEMFDMPSGGTNFYLMTFQLVQLTNIAGSGTDVGAGAIVWENSYEVKFQEASSI